ncbi:MAG: Crp/Fnr family transcriptional regulator [Chitinophagaceae bacterium]|nr:Crp/Fnr family transcriptional regulator [Chitinophagaceae bacterium]
MFDILIAYFQQKWIPTSEEIALIKSSVTPRSLKKGEFLQREGETAKYGAFVAKGFLRSYVIDEKGKEHIIQFAPENWWISDKLGMSKDGKASFFIDAIEDSETLLMDLGGHKTLLEQVPGYAASFRSGMEKRGAAKDKRIVQALSSSAEERYNDFLETYPSIAQRVPQHMLASFLGITPETLSRIRKSLSKAGRRP